ncbi:LiaI-LiaF-like domain-containing protein [Larkinella sp. VNQ87]|uniref:LiaI-LiaF-like domain-containing protein n=1 Tax=Larkinella sp. VNQ87 TaxID=3400921 RepID=UPI003C04393D
MNRTGLFWGIALITLGVVFLAHNYGWFYVDWSFFSQFWPVLIILAGLNLIFQRRNPGAALVTTVLLAVSVPLAIVGAFHGNRWHNDRYEYHYDSDDDDQSQQQHDGKEEEENRDEDRPKVQTSHIAEPMDATIQQAKLRFESGAGRFYIGSPSDSLIEADTRMSVSKYSMSVSRSDETRSADIDLQLDDENIKLKSGELVNVVDLRLNAKPAWSFDFGIGAGQANFDLSAYDVRSVKLGAGAADIDLKLGDRAPQSMVKIESGVTSVTLKVPKTVGCQVETQGALTVKKLDGFDEIGGGVYQTPGYAASPKKITVRYEGGVSRFAVERY